MSRWEIVKTPHILYSESERETIADKMVKTEEEWRRTLTPEEYRLLRQEGTEPAFSGKLWDTKEKGIYVCAGCENELFSSATKFDSGTGWPSFFRPISEHSVETKPDNRLFMRRTAVECSRCGGHLGHVFDDGPNPTGLRYCMNSGALHFKPAGKDGEG